MAQRQAPGGWARRQVGQWASMQRTGSLDLAGSHWELGRAGCVRRAGVPAGLPHAATVPTAPPLLPRSSVVYKARFNGEAVAAKEMDIGASLAVQEAFIAVRRRRRRPLLRLQGPAAAAAAAAAHQRGACGLCYTRRKPRGCRSCGTQTSWA